MRKYPTSVFASEIWQEIEFIFWREHVPCLPFGTSGDGIEPVNIETTKRGVEISGTIWFLPAGNYDLSLCLLRPGFSSIESVSVLKLRNAVIADSTLEGRTLTITVTVSGETPSAADR
jgi:hypothetical protein